MPAENYWCETQNPEGVFYTKIALFCLVEEDGDTYVEGMDVCGEACLYTFCSEDRYSDIIYHLFNLYDNNEISKLLIKKSLSAPLSESEKITLQRILKQ